MQFSQKIYKLNGKLQHYTWGGAEFLPKLLGLPNPSGQPCAEFWMGAHKNGASIVCMPGGAGKKLDDFISEHPIEILGDRVNRDFGRLPYLFKILDVRDMLSIQVHPNKQAAEIEFERENKKGVPLNADNRNYKDNNHKPELMLALGPFWLLHGFKPAGLLKQKLEEIEELHFLLPQFAGNDYRRLYRYVMEMDQEEVNTRFQPLVDRIVPAYDKGMLQRNQEDFWAARAVKTFCEPGRIDRGIFSIYLFNLVFLNRGEAIFQDAGILHAYLEGQNIEIMANSDNVLRGGLTKKHVDVKELLKHVKFEAVTPLQIKPVQAGDSLEVILPSPAADFELRQLKLEPTQTTRIRASTADIFLVYDGKLTVKEGNDQMQLKRGEVMLAITGSQLIFEAIEPSLIYHATVPFPQQ